MQIEAHRVPGNGYGKIKNTLHRKILEEIDLENSA